MTLEYRKTYARVLKGCKKKGAGVNLSLIFKNSRGFHPQMMIILKNDVSRALFIRVW